MRVGLAIVVLAACGDAKDPPRPAPPAAPSPAAAPPAPAVGKLPTFRVLSSAERAATARAFAATFPSAWNANIEVDAAGFAINVDLSVAVEDGKAIAEVLRIVGDHPKVFGVRAPKALHAEIKWHDVWVGEGDRWTGSITARLRPGHVAIAGHLWPFATPAVTASADRALKPYLGLAIRLPSKCTKGCGHDTVGVTTSKDSFTTTAAIAMVCGDGVLTARPAIAIEARFNASGVPPLAKLPRLVDADTQAPIEADFVMPPHGAATEGAPATFETSVHAYYGGRCFGR